MTGDSQPNYCVKGNSGWCRADRVGWHTAGRNNALIRVIPCQAEAGPAAHEHCTGCWPDATSSPETQRGQKGEKIRHSLSFSCQHWTYFAWLTSLISAESGRHTVYCVVFESNHPSDVSDSFIKRYPDGTHNECFLCFCHCPACYLLDWWMCWFFGGI